MNAAIGKTYSSILIERPRNYRSFKKNFISAEELCIHIKRCALNNRESQKAIYNTFSGFVMGICNRYTNSPDELNEMLSNGFLKIFKEIQRYKLANTDEPSAFEGWLRKITVSTAISHYVKNHKQLTAELYNKDAQLLPMDENTLEGISNEKIISSIKELAPAYRTVYNLYVVDGFTHEEIAKQLGISVSTSQSTLAMARKQLRQKLIQFNIFY